jgi:hypothetical protein
MRCFHDSFPEIAQKDVLVVQAKNEAVHDGIYTFLEYYCDNLACRCTTVVLDVMFSDENEPEKGKHIASINYAWEKPLSRKNPSFHTEAPRTDMSEAAIKVFHRVVAQDSSYKNKLAGHFELLRNHVRLEMQGSANIQNNVSKLGRNSPCVCGSGKKYKKCCLME